MRVKLDTFPEVRTTPVAGVWPVMKLTDLRNWYSGAPARSATEDMPDSDGAFEAEATYRGSKALALEGWVQARSVEEAEELAYDYVAGVAPLGEAMTLEVESSSGLLRYMTVRLNGTPAVEPFTDRRARFQIPLIAADPRKYGPALPRAEWPSAAPSGGSADGLAWPLMGPVTTGTMDFGTFSPSGLIEITNGGRAPAWVIWHATGPIDSSGFDIISDTNVIRYAAAVPLGSEVVLDPYAGGRATVGGVDVTGANLTRSEWVPILPGETRAFAFDPLGVSDASARLLAEFREAWW